MNHLAREFHRHFIRLLLLVFVSLEAEKHRMRSIVLSFQAEECHSSIDDGMITLPKSLNISLGLTSRGMSFWVSPCEKESEPIAFNVLLFIHSREFLHRSKQSHYLDNQSSSPLMALDLHVITISHPPQRIHLLPRYLIPSR